MVFTTEGVFEVAIILLIFYLRGKVYKIKYLKYFSFTLMFIEKKKVWLKEYGLEWVVTRKFLLKMGSIFMGAWKYFKNGSLTRN